MNTKINMGFTSVTFRGKTPEEICAIAQNNGIASIEWGADVHVPSPVQAEHVRRLCAQYGIKTISLGSYYRVGDGKPEDFEKDCRSAEILGCKRIRVWLGRKSSAVTSDNERKILLDETKRLAGIAKYHGLTVAFEFHKNTYNDSGNISASFIKECSEDNIGTYWQPFSLGNDEENLKNVIPYLSAVHVFSWDENNIRYPLSYKLDEWKKYIKIVKENVPDCDFIMEFVKDDSEKSFSEDVIALRKISDMI